MKRLLLGLFLLPCSFALWAANEFAFAPCGSTVLVDSTARQVTCSSSTLPQSYRIRNLGSAAAYLTWSTANISSGVAPTGLSATAPVAGTPAPNVIGMLPQSVETFTLPANAWFQAGTTFTFEVTPGDGR